MRMALKALALVAVVTLAACSTLSIDTAARLRALDLRNDDIADLVLALDVPVALVPEPDQSRVVLSATKSDGSVISTEIMLVRADAQDMAEHLPPPAQDRGYYLFGFAEADKQKLRDTQAEIRNAQARNPEVKLKLGFCVLTQINPDTTSFSAHVALPGADRLEPLISRESIAQLLASTGQSELSPCGSFSN